MRSGLIIFSILFLGSAPAQESRGTLTGRISDSSGASVANAKLHALNQETNTGGGTTTNHEGNFEIPFLIPGTYRLTVEAQGFKKSVRTGIAVTVNDRITADVVLEVGDLAQSVTVSAESTSLDTNSASIGLSIDDKQITDLPVAGGSPFYLARLAAGVTATGGHSPGNPFDQGHASSTIVVNGTRTGSSEVSMDGASNMSGGGASASPPQDLVQEFKIQTLAFDASLGHGTGAIVNVSVRSGTNQLHGTTYFFDSFIRSVPWFVNNFLYNPQTGPITPEKIAQSTNNGWLHQRWGTTFTGPIFIPKVYDGRNKSFFSFGYEAMYVRRTPTFTGTVPTDSQRDGDFSSLLAIRTNYQIYDPYSIKDAGNGLFTRQPLARNIIPPSQISPIAKNILAYYPKQNTPGAVDAHNNYFRVNDEDKDYSSYLSRIDHNFSENHRVYFRINQNYYQQTIQTLPTIAAGDFNGRRVWGGVFDDVLVLNPRLLLNLRYGITYQAPWTTHFSQGFDFTALGLPASLLNQTRDKNGIEGLAFPQITIGGYTGLGSAGGSRSATNYQTFTGTMTHLAGSHSLRFGGEFRLERENGYNFGNVAPNLDFNPTWSKGPNQNSVASPIGQGLAEFLYGLPSGGQINVNASRAEQSTFYGLFLQDDWRVAKRLTVNAGLRWEMEGPTTERYNRSVRGFDFNTANPVDAAARAQYAAAPNAALPVDQFKAFGGLTFPGVNGQPHGLWTADKNNFAPRIGLAWTASKGTVIRTGYGIFHGLMGIDRLQVNQGGFNQVTTLVPSLDNGLHYRATLANPFPDGIEAPTGASQGLLTQIGKAPSYFLGNPVSPYMQRWTFSMQRMLGSRTVFEATYVGNRGTHLQANRQFDPIPRQYLSTKSERDGPVITFLGAQVANPFASLPEFFGTTLGTQRIAVSQLLRPYPEFTGITANIPDGYSYYHSLQVRLDRRFSKGFSFQFAYTWSKFMEATSYLNGSDLRPEKVISDQDYPHRAVIGGIYEFPFGKGKHWLTNVNRITDGVLGGWQVQGWYEGQSGQALGFGNMIFRGNLHDIVLPVSERTISRWFNTDAGFEKNTALQLANNIRVASSRFTGIRGDGTNNLDMSLFKIFRINERWRAQFRMETYNTANHAQFANPDTNVTSAAFGTVTAEKGHGQRQGTIAIKILF